MDESFTFEEKQDPRLKRKLDEYGLAREKAKKAKKEVSDLDQRFDDAQDKTRAAKEKTDEAEREVDEAKRKYAKALKDGTLEDEREALVELTMKNKARTRCLAALSSYVEKCRGIREDYEPCVKRAIAALKKEGEVIDSIGNLYLYLLTSESKKEKKDDESERG